MTVEAQPSLFSGRSAAIAAPARYGHMSRHPTPVERAFELARSGQHATVDEIRQQMKREGLDHAQVAGPVLLKQLRTLCTESVARQAAEDEAKAKADADADAST
jgi:hypothetical protein